VRARVAADPDRLADPDVALEELADGAGAASGVGSVR
jgi:hypothetical protein